MPVTLTLDELRAAEDLDLGTSSWVRIGQESIDRFAAATGDHQWIHVDPERAQDGPYGTTIAHGYLTISLLPQLIGELLTVPDAGVTVNYGSDRVRFLTPVPVDSRVRATGRIVDASDKAGGVLLQIETTVEIEGHDRPALSATILSLRTP